MTRYAEYIRVSGSSQAERKTHAIQQAALLRLREWRPGTLVPGSGPTGAFEDLAVSGASLEIDRPAWAQVIQMVRDGTLDEVRIHAFDRLIRSEQPVVWGQLVQDFKDSNAIIVETSGAVIDVRGKSGFEAMMMLHRAMGAGEERARIAKRFLDGRRTAAGAADKRGGWGAIPFGYRHEPRQGYLIDERDLGDGWTPPKVVRYVFELARTCSKDQICARLDAERVPTPRGSRKWSRATVGGWLNCSAYKGELVGRLPAEVDDRGRPRPAPPGVREIADDGPVQWEYTIQLEPIVDPRDWDLARAACEARKHRPADDYVEFEALFRHFAYCGVCDGKMQAVNARLKGVRYPRYRCFNKACAQRAGHPIPAVDRAAWRVLEDRLCNPAILEAGLRSDHTVDGGWPEIAEKARAAIAAFTKEIADLLGQFGHSSATVRELVGKRITEIESSIAVRQADVARAERAMAQEVEFTQRWAAVRSQVEGWAERIRAGLTYEQRRELVKGLFGPGDGKIVLHPKGHIEVICDVLAAGPTKTGGGGGSSVMRPVAAPSSTRSRAGTRGTGCSCTRSRGRASRSSNGWCASRPRTPGDPPSEALSPTRPTGGRTGSSGSRRGGTYVHIAGFAAPATRLVKRGSASGRRGRRRRWRRPPPGGGPGTGRPR